MKRTKWRSWPVIVFILLAVVAVRMCAAADIDPYRTLGVDRRATEKQITKAYRKLVRQYHPDVSKAPDAREQFEKVQQAYDILSDSEKKAFYDQNGFAPGVNGRDGPQGQNPFSSHPFYGFRHFQAQPIESVAPAMTIDVLRKWLAYRGDNLVVIQLYIDQSYESRAFATTWESLVKSRLRRYINFYRIHAMRDRECLEELKVRVTVLPTVVCVMDGVVTTVPLGDSFMGGPAGAASTLSDLTDWLAKTVSGVAADVEMLRDADPTAIRAWAAGLKSREVGVLIFPPQPEDDSLLLALSVRLPRRTRRIARIPSRDTIRNFLQQCPQLRLPQLDSVKEVVMVFNESDSCDVHILTATSLAFKSERLLSLVGHRAVPPLTPGVCGRTAPPFSTGQGSHHPLCLVWILQPGHDVGQALGRPPWLDRLQQLTHDVHLTHVVAAEEPDFVDRLTLVEIGTTPAVEPLPSDLIFLFYDASNPSRYGVMRVRDDADVLERLERKLVSGIPRFLQGQKLYQHPKASDIMGLLVRPTFPTAWWRFWWLAYGPLMDSVPSGLFSLVMLYFITKFILTPMAAQHQRPPNTNYAEDWRQARDREPGRQQ